LNKIISLALLLCLMISCVACGNSMDNNSSDISITLPASIYEGTDMSAFNPVAEAEKKGYKEVVVNEDGSVTITMTKDRHNQILSDLKLEYSNNISSLTNSSEYPYLLDIQFNDNFSEFAILVDKEGYISASDLTPYTLYMAAAFYQMFEGNEPSCLVLIKDQMTDELINIVHYPNNIAN